MTKNAAGPGPGDSARMLVPTLGRIAALHRDEDGLAAGDAAQFSLWGSFLVLPRISFGHSIGFEQHFAFETVQRLVASFSAAGEREALVATVGQVGSTGVFRHLLQFDVDAQSLVIGEMLRIVDPPGQSPEAVVA